MSIKEELIKKEPDVLADLIIKLLDGLDENSRLDFIAKYISARVALDCIEKDNEEVFLDEVETFCLAVLDGDYYVEADYDDYNDSYDEETFESSEWAKLFTEYLRLATIYARNGDKELAYAAFSRLIACIEVTEKDFEMLGTDTPIEYLNIDIEDVFDTYFNCILTQCEDNYSAYKKMFTLWRNFQYYTSGILRTYIADLTQASDVVFDLIKNEHCFENSEKLYLLLKDLYDIKNEKFDEIAYAIKLIAYEKNFSFYVANGYFESGRWNETISTIINDINKCCDRIKDQMMVLLTDAYLKNDQMQNAYETALKIFHQKVNFKSYKRLRYIAQKLMGIESFIEETVDFIKISKNYILNDLLCKIFSFEGKFADLLEMFPQEYQGESYNIAKYISKALVFRVFGESTCPYMNITEYNESTKQAGIDGILDMIRVELTDTQRGYIVENAITMLKAMVQFHIDATTRSRYVRAAYYSSVIYDLYLSLGQADKWNEYIAFLMQQNNRRPAFKEEMRNKFKGI
jgi:hypothetical protein